MFGLTDRSGFMTVLAHDPDRDFVMDRIYFCTACVCMYIHVHTSRIIGGKYVNPLRPGGNYITICFDSQ